MAHLGKHGRNVLWMLLLDLFNKAVSLFYFSYLFTRFSKTENEYYAQFIMALVVLVSVIGFGLQEVLSRDVAKDHKLVHTLLGSSMALQTMIFVPLALSVWPVTGWLGFPYELRIVLALAPLAALLEVCIEMHQTIFAAHGLFKYPSLLGIATRVVTVGGAVCLMERGHGVIALAAWVTAVYGLGVAATYVSLVAVCGRYGFSVSLRDMRYLTAQGSLMAVGRCASTAFSRVDLPLLRSGGFAASAVDYAVGPRFFELLVSIPIAAENVFYPVLARKVTDAADAQRFAFERYLKYMYLLAFPMAAGMTVLAHPIVVTLAGARYAEGAGIVAVMTWMAAFAAVDRAAAVYLRALGRQHLAMYAYLGELGLKLALALPVVRAFGVPGLLVLNGALSGITALGLLKVASANLVGARFHRLLTIGVRPGIAALAMTAALLPVRDCLILVSIPLGGVFYGVALLALRAFDDFDAALLRQTLPPRLARVWDKCGRAMR